MAPLETPFINSASVLATDMTTRTSYSSYLLINLTKEFSTPT